jgi:hypothetical protein
MLLRNKTKHSRDIRRRFDFERRAEMADVTYGFVTYGFVTYGFVRVPTAEPAAQAARAKAAAPRKKWFAHVMDALIESRMQQAHRELARHAHLLPYSLDERGNRLVKTGSGDMPCGG